jgi:hypothetical protein
LLSKAVTRYINSKIKKEAAAADEVDEDVPLKIKEIYTIRDVIKQNMQPEIEKEIPVEKTDKSYIGHYQRAVTTVLGKMNETQLDEAEAVVEAWNKRGAPVDAQRK